MDAAHHKAIVGLLLESFDNQEFRRFIAQVATAEHARRLPAGTASDEQLVWDGFALLERESRIDADFFEAWRTERKKRYDEITALAEAAGVVLTARPGRTFHDLFLSYRTHHAARVEPVIAALEAEGVRVWRDVDRIQSGELITAGLRAGLAGSRALAVFASEDYADSRICAWELASAWIAAESRRQTAQRVFLLLPEGVALPRERFGSLVDHRAFAVPAGDPTEVAREIAGHLATCGASTFGEMVELAASPRWVPYHRSGSNHFTGRLGDLWDLHGKLVRSRQVGITGHVGSPVAQVRGLGGIGKTLFAIEYARRFEAAWPGGVFWFDADDGWSADAEAGELYERRCRLLVGLAGAMGVQQIQGDVMATAHAVETALRAQANGRPYLWILDNVPPGTSQQAIDALMPPDLHGALLLTTRWRALNSLGDHLDLGVLGPEEALALLTGDRAPSDEAERVAAVEVIEAVGRHPYALDVLRALIRDDVTHPAPYRKWARRLADIRDDSLDEAAKELAEVLPTGKARAISAVFASSLEGRSEAALDVLRLAAVLADAPCPGEFVAAVLERSGHGEAAIERAIGQLAAHALVMQDLEVRGIYVHSLVRRVAARWRCDPAHLDALATHAREVLHPRFKEIDPLDLRQHSPLLPLLPHALVLADAPTILAARLGVNVGNFVMARGSETGLVKAPRGAATLPPITVRGAALARKLFEAACVIFERESGVDSDFYLGTLTNFAGCLQDQGDLVGARSCYEKVLATRRRNLGPENRGTLEAQQNLAVTVKAQGDYRYARELLENALAVGTCQFGATDRIVLAIELNLATVDQAQGNYGEALERTKRVFDGMSGVHGSEHSMTTRVLSNMAGLFATMGDLKAARRDFEQVLHIDERDKGPEHPDTLQDRQNLATLLYQEGDWARARASEEEVLAARERVLGPDHPDTLTTRSNLAVSCERLNDLNAARMHRARAHEGFERTLGPHHPKTLLSLHNRAILLRSQGDLEQARKTEENVFSKFMQRLGPDHPWTLASQHHIAELMREQGQLVGAHAKYREVLAARQRLQGDRHPDTLKTQQGIAETLIMRGKHAAAQALLAGLLPVLEEVLPDHPDTMMARYKLVSLLHRIDPKLAEPHMPKLRELRARDPDKLSLIERDIVKGLLWIEHPEIKIEFRQMGPSPAAPVAAGRRRRPRRVED